METGGGGDAPDEVLPLRFDLLDAQSETGPAAGDASVEIAPDDAAQPDHHHRGEGEPGQAREAKPRVERHDERSGEPGDDVDVEPARDGARPRQLRGALAHRVEPEEEEEHVSPMMPSVWPT